MTARRFLPTAQSLEGRFPLSGPDVSGATDPAAPPMFFLPPAPAPIPVASLAGAVADAAVSAAVRIATGGLYTPVAPVTSSPGTALFPATAGNPTSALPPYPTP